MWIQTSWCTKLAYGTWKLFDFLNEFYFFLMVFISGCTGFSLLWAFFSSGGARASLVAEHGLKVRVRVSFSSYSMSSVAVVSRLSCSRECGIFPDQGWNPRPLHWQLDSLPLSPRGPFSIFEGAFFNIFYCNQTWTKHSLPSTSFIFSSTTFMIWWWDLLPGGCFCQNKPNIFHAAPSYNGSFVLLGNQDAYLAVVVLVDLHLHFHSFLSTFHHGSTLGTVGSLLSHQSKSCAFMK